MPYFSIGPVSFGLSALAAVAYLGAYAARCAGAWFQRGDYPRERVIPILLCALVFGFVLGSALQPRWDVYRDCKAQGVSLFVCFTQRMQ